MAGDSAMDRGARILMQGWCRVLAGAFMVSVASTGPVVAQDIPAPPPPDPVAPAAAAPESLRLPAGTPVEFEFVTPLDSRTARIDAMFPIRLTRPVRLGGAVAIPAGTMGEGQVVHAAKSGWGGKAGELIVAARHIEWKGTRVPLRRFRMGEIETGEDRRGTAFAASVIVSPFVGFFINGGEKSILVGTRANAIVSTDTDLPAAPAPAGPPATDATPAHEGDLK